VRVDGYDVDEASIDLARANAAADGLADRVRFHHRDVAAADGEVDGGYDLVTAGFGDVEVLDIEHPFFRFYRLR
jgi:tRNA1(Val) A37 N6-methylase TrmN6